MADGEKPVIRMARIEDAEAIHAALLSLATHLGDVSKIKSTVNDIRRHGFGDEPAFECLIAETAGEIAGICLFFRSFSSWFGKPGIYVQDLVVHESYRGRGLGVRLLGKAASIAQSRGWIYMRLAVDHENPTAMRFYERLGFVRRFDDLVYAAHGDAFAALAVGHEDGAR